MSKAVLVSNKNFAANKAIRIVNKGSNIVYEINWSLIKKKVRSISYLIAVVIYIGIALQLNSFNETLFTYYVLAGGIFLFCLGINSRNVNQQ